MEKNKLLNWLLFMLTCLGLAVLLLLVFAIPAMANRTSLENPDYSHLRIPVMIYVYITSLPFFAGLFQAMKICREVSEGNEFTDNNVASMVSISKYAFSEIILYTVGAGILLVLDALHPGILLIILATIFVAGAVSIFSAVLSYYMKKAVLLREENEQTI